MQDTPTLTLAHGMDRAEFLARYWQKAPLLMRNALPASSFPLSPEELAGLACEPELESRLIVQRGPSDYHLRHGPFRDADFLALPDSRWTLLVQDVDKFLPDVARLMGAFDFVPGWRVDDIMISYAADQGGVGPHTDAYDVFLIQGLGRRRWKISHTEYTDDDLEPDLELRILQRFACDEEWLLEPGDILYLPPGLAHWGIAEGPCMTYSLGFRAPSQQDLAADWFQHLVAKATDQRLRDPADLDCHSVAELTPGLTHAAAMLLKGLGELDSDDFRDWLGCYLTEAKPQFQVSPPDQLWDRHALDAWMHADRDLFRHPAASIAWRRTDNDGVRLYCQGNSLSLSEDLLELAKYLAEHRQLDATQLGHRLRVGDAAVRLILDLLNAGFLEPEDSAPST